MKKSAILFGLLLLAPVVYGQETAEPDTTLTVVFEYDGAGNRIARTLVTGQSETGGGDGSAQTAAENLAAEAKLPDDADIDERQFN